MGPGTKKVIGKALAKRMIVKLKWIGLMTKGENLDGLRGFTINSHLTQTLSQNEAQKCMEPKIHKTNCQQEAVPNISEKT